MRWRKGRRSQNVEDRRGLKVPGGAKGIGIGSIIAIAVAVFFGGDASSLLRLLGPMMGSLSASSDTGRTDTTAEPLDDEAADFVSVVLADTEDVWGRLFREMGKEYVEPQLVLFRDEVKSACGFQSAAVGPFYCPADDHVYLDLSFFDDLARRHDAPGDFAQAYVIAHEVGHHVQNLLGISERVHAMKQGLSEAEANKLSVGQELQADFFAGVWAHHANRERQILEAGDIEEALNAASAIGDDRLQKDARGYVTPDSFTHGSSAQRVRWFRKGLETGDVSQGDTFNDLGIHTQR